MADQRIKGQETEIILVANNQPQLLLNTIKDFEFSFDLEILSEGYLGETTERKDSVFKGITGKLTLHMNNQQPLLLAAQLVDKARRRLPGFQVNIKTTLNFPNGQRPKIVIPDVEIGQLPFGFPAREQYVNLSLNYAASAANVIPG